MEAIIKIKEVEKSKSEVKINLESHVKFFVSNYDHFIRKAYDSVELP